jgi:hypothetical protein
LKANRRLDLELNNFKNSRSKRENRSFSCPSFTLFQRLRSFMISWRQSILKRNHLSGMVLGNLGFLPLPMMFIEKFCHVDRYVVAKVDVQKVISCFQTKEKKEG